MSASPSADDPGPPSAEEQRNIRQMLLGLDDGAPAAARGGAGGMGALLALAAASTRASRLLTGLSNSPVASGAQGVLQPYLHDVSRNAVASLASAVIAHQRASTARADAGGDAVTVTSDLSPTHSAARTKAGDSAAAAVADSPEEEASALGPFFEGLCLKVCATNHACCSCCRFSLSPPLTAANLHRCCLTSLSASWRTRWRRTWC